MGAALAPERVRQQSLVAGVRRAGPSVALRVQAARVPASQALEQLGERVWEQVPERLMGALVPERLQGPEVRGSTGEEEARRPGVLPEAGPILARAE